MVCCLFGSYFVTAVIILAQPDTDTFLLMAVAGAAMFVTAGAKWQHILLLGLAGILLITAVAFARPYVMDRITTFINPSSDVLGSGYQIQQSLIAVGSGGFFGRGYGQSIQSLSTFLNQLGTQFLQFMLKSLALSVLFVWC